MIRWKLEILLYIVEGRLKFMPVGEVLILVFHLFDWAMRLTAYIVPRIFIKDIFYLFKERNYNILCVSVAFYNLLYFTFLSFSWRLQWNNTLILVLFCSEEPLYYFCGRETFYSNKLYFILDWFLVFITYYVYFLFPSYSFC